MKYYKKPDGTVFSFYKSLDGFEEIAEEVFNERMNNTTAKLEKIAALNELTRPLTADEVNRLFIAQNINTVITDDATASRAVEFHPEMRQDKVQTATTPLIRAGTRIRWGNGLKKAAVDLWDTEQNNPDNAPTLWADLRYKNGFRIIDEVLTVTTAFANGELGWWGDTLFRSMKDNNVYTPAVRPEDWEVMHGES